MDPIQEGEVRLHSWHLYTSKVPVLDLTNKPVTNTIEFLQAFDDLNLCKMLKSSQHMAEKQLEKNEKLQKTEHIPDSDTSDEELVTNPHSDEERHYGTIPSSALATRAVLSHSTAQTNPTVER